MVMKLCRTYGAHGELELMLRGFYPRLYYFAFTRLFRELITRQKEGETDLSDFSDSWRGEILAIYFR